MSCECCGKSYWRFKDLRPKKDLFRGGTKFDYKTPLHYYVRFKVCDSCYKLDDTPFYKLLEQTEKKALKMQENELQVVGTK